MGIAHIEWLHAFAISSAIQRTRHPSQSATPTHMSMGHAFHPKFFFWFFFFCFYASQNPTRLTLCEFLTLGFNFVEGGWHADGDDGWFWVEL